MGFQDLEFQPVADNGLVEMVDAFAEIVAGVFHEQCFSGVDAIGLDGLGLWPPDNFFGDIIAWRQDELALESGVEG